MTAKVCLNRSFPSSHANLRCCGCVFHHKSPPIIAISKPTFLQHRNCSAWPADSARGCRQIERPKLLQYGDTRNRPEGKLANGGGQPGRGSGSPSTTSQWSSRAAALRLDATPACKTSNLPNVYAEHNATFPLIPSTHSKFAACLCQSLKRPPPPPPSRRPAIPSRPLQADCEVLHGDLAGPQHSMSSGRKYLDAPACNKAIFSTPCQNDVVVCSASAQKDFTTDKGGVCGHLQQEMLRAPCLSTVKVNESFQKVWSGEKPTHLLSAKSMSIPAPPPPPPPPPPPAQPKSSNQWPYELLVKSASSLAPHSKEKQLITAAAVGHANGGRTSLDHRSSCWDTDSAVVSSNSLVADGMKGCCDTIVPTLKVHNRGGTTPIKSPFISKAALVTPRKWSAKPRFSSPENPSGSVKFRESPGNQYAACSDLMPPPPPPPPPPPLWRDPHFRYKQELLSRGQPALSGRRHQYRFPRAKAFSLYDPWRRPHASAVASLSPSRTSRGDIPANLSRNQTPPTHLKRRPRRSRGKDRQSFSEVNREADFGKRTIHGRMQSIEQNWRSNSFLCRPTASAPSRCFASPDVWGSSFSRDLDSGPVGGASPASMSLDGPDNAADDFQSSSAREMTGHAFVEGDVVTHLAMPLDNPPNGVLNTPPAPIREEFSVGYNMWQGAPPVAASTFGIPLPPQPKDAPPYALMFYPCTFGYGQSSGGCGGGDLVQLPQLGAKTTKSTLRQHSQHQANTCTWISQASHCIPVRLSALQSHSTDMGYVPPYLPVEGPLCDAWGLLVAPPDVLYLPTNAGQLYGAWPSAPIYQQTVPEIPAGIAEICMSRGADGAKVSSPSQTGGCLQSESTVTADCRADDSWDLPYLHLPPAVLECSNCPEFCESCDDEEECSVDSSEPRKQEQLRLKVCWETLAAANALAKGVEVPSNFRGAEDIAIGNSIEGLASRQDHEVCGAAFPARRGLNLRIWEADAIAQKECAVMRDGNCGNCGNGCLDHSCDSMQGDFSSSVFSYDAPTLPSLRDSRMVCCAVV